MSHTQESVIVVGAGLAGLVAAYEAIKGGKSVDDILLETTKVLNAVLPNYSQVNKLELLQGEFVHTPKMSIKRSLYK